MGPRAREGSATGLLTAQGVLPLGSYDHSDTLVLEVSVADMDAVCSLW